MIYITQGHEEAIGIEVFLKSFICLQTNQQKKFVLSCFKDTLINNLNKLKFSFEINDSLVRIGESVSLQCIFQKKCEQSQTLKTLTEILDVITDKDILLTLPTSKDQLVKLLEKE